MGSFSGRRASHERDGLKSLLQRNLEPTPLHYAAEREHVEVVESLLRRGANCTLKCGHEQPRLHVAVSRACVRRERIRRPLTARETRLCTTWLPAETSKLYVSSHQPSSRSRQTSRPTPLHLSCKDGHTVVVSALLSARAYNNAADGLRPLHYAADDDHPAIIETLLSSSRNSAADIEAPARELGRPLHHTSHHGHASAVSALLAAGVAIEARISSGARRLPALMAIAIA